MSVLDKYECEGQMSMFDLYGRDFSCGRMYQVPYQAPEKRTEVQTLGAYSKKFAELRIKMPQFLCLMGGGWSTSGCIMGDGYSVAWRVHDAQFWGVPQRRKRIALVADFGGLSAPEILFERKGLSRDTTESGEQGQGIATNTERSSDKAISFQERAGCAGGGKGILIQHERTGALSTLNNQSVCMTVDEKMGQTYIHEEQGNTLSARDYKQPQAVVYGISPYDSNAMKSSNPHSGIYEADTSRTLDLNGGSPACNQGGMVVLEGNGSRPSHQGDGYKKSEVSYTLNSTEQHSVCYSQDAYDKFTENEKCASLKASGGTYGGGSEALAIQQVKR